MRNDVAALLKLIAAMEAEGQVLHTDAVYDKGWNHFHAIMHNAFPRSGISDQKRLRLLADAVNRYNEAINHCSAEVMGLECPQEYHLARHIEPMLMKIINRSASPMEVYRSHLDLLSTFHSIRAKEPVRFFGICGLHGERSLRIKFRPERRLALEQALAEHDDLPEATRGMVVEISDETAEMIDKMLRCLLRGDGLQ